MADVRHIANQNEHPRLKDERARGFFYDYNEIFELGLSPYAGWVRMYLIRLANSDSVAFPSYTKIADVCCMSKSSARRAVEELIEAGLLVKRQRKKRGSNEYDSNEYAILDPRPLISTRKPDEGDHVEGYVPTEHTYAPTKHRYVLTEHTPMFSENTPYGPTEHITIPTYQYTNDSYTDRQTDSLSAASARSSQPDGLSVNLSSSSEVHTDQPDALQIVTDAYHRHVGVLGPSQFAKLRFWVDEMAMMPEVVAYAIQVAVEQKSKDKHPPRISYIEGILRNWHNSNLATLADVQEHEHRVATAKAERERKSKPGLTREEALALMAEHDAAKQEAAKARAEAIWTTAELHKADEKVMDEVNAGMLEAAVAAEPQNKKPESACEAVLPPALAAIHKRHIAAMATEAVNVRVT